MVLIRLVFIHIFFFFFLNSSLFALNNKKIKVVFISVAAKEEVFWNGIHELAKKAAKDLGVELKILYSNRDHLLAVRMAKNIAKSKNKPDYVIVVAEKLIASLSIPILSKSNIKVLVLGNINKKKKEEIGNPKEKYKNYIGKISIDDYSAGYLTMEVIIKEAIKKKLYDKNGYINFLSLEGVRETSFNYERVRGMKDVLKKYPKVRILQSVSTKWRYMDAVRILPAFLKRYSQYRIAGVWCANSELARGASDVLKLNTRTHDANFLTVGTDWDINSIENVNKGDILAIAGGHVAILAWLIVLIYDYHNGVELGPNIFLNKITIINRNTSSKYLEIFNKNNWDFIDFKRFSRFKNKKLKKYDFKFENFLHDL